MSAIPMCQLVYDKVVVIDSNNIFQSVSQFYSTKCSFPVEHTIQAVTTMLKQVALCVYRAYVLVNGE